MTSQAPGLMSRLKTRLAGSAPIQWARSLPRGARIGGTALGLGGLASVIGAAMELGDQNDPLARNLTEAAGGLTGGLGGTAAGAAIGAALGGPAAPITGTIGAILGGIGGGMGGSAVGGGLYNAVAGDPNDPLRQQQRAFDMALNNEVKRAEAMLGPQAAAAALARQNEIERARAMAALQNQQITQQALAQSMLEQQRAGAAGLDRMTAAILGYGGGGYGV